MEEPLPCPFCGSTDLATEWAWDQIYLECISCGACGPVTSEKSEKETKRAKAKEKAIKAWNKRRG